ncbi:DUF4402 domain-containing protein [Sphingomonas xanthus]|uniref:DUF4402 domain-containing protein n=1 Tax=Sphingomonas xanthus TaxID=2594473 RepID=A0A516IRN3_9SPHN|nr:DUF4402 domain-containing protein [Sphingomonas xanthus]QDP19563.1 DUF4402 domain-containing protein [Sphingomonas xanthus]
MGQTAALLYLLSLLGPTVPAPAQDAGAPCRLCATGDKNSPDARAAPVHLDVQARLDFDRLIVSGNGEGSAHLGPSGERSVSGSVEAIGARAMVGEVAIRGEPGRLIRISLPSAIELHGFTGGRIRLESIRSDLPATPRLDSAGRLTFRFGGVIRVTGDTDGQFRGDIPIDVDYF